MPALAAPPTPQSTPSVDPTPGPGDITSFDQVKGGPPAASPSTATANGSTAPATPLKEIHLDGPSDPNRVNQMPESVWDDLEKFTVADETGSESTAKVPPAPAPEAKPDDQQAAPAQPAGDDAEIEQQVAAHKTLKDVRTAFKEQLKREREWKREQEAVKTKLTDYETRLKSGDTEAARTLTTELEARQTKIAELEQQVRNLDYTKSEEFREKFVRPVTKVLENAYTDLKEMVVTEEDGTVRAATEDDFKALLQMPLGQATTTAKQRFGDLASEVLAHRRSIIQLERAKREAIENAGKESEALIQRRAADETKRTTRLQGLFQQRAQELETKYPELFKPTRDGDAEGNELVVKGKKLVELLNDGSLDEENRIRIAAEVNARVIGYGRLLRDHKRVSDELATFKAKLKEFDKSAPREGNTAANGVPEGPRDPMERALREIDKFTTPS